MPKEYKDLKLRIYRQPPQHPEDMFGPCRQILEAPDYSSAEGSIYLAPDLVIMNKVARLGTVGDELVKFGSALFQQLFEPANVAARYHTVRGQIDADLNTGLRIQLIPQDLGIVPLDAPERSLQQLPWEYLYDAGEERFLALNPDRLSLVRSSTNVGACVAQPTSRPVRVLTVLADANVGPKKRINVETERQLIEDAVNQSGLSFDVWKPGGPAVEAADVDVFITHLDQVPDAEGQPQKASRNALEKYLESHPKPHILHFCCHGSFDGTTGEGELVLEKNPRPGRKQGNQDPLPTRDLRPWLSDLAPALRLVVFNACSTAPTQDVAAFKSIADAAVQAGVPAVIAMQFDIPLDVGTMFTQSFHSHLFKACLAEGHSIDLAVARARKEILNQKPADQPHWGIPVLYRHPSGVEPFQKVPLGQWQAVRDLLDELVFQRQQRDNLKKMIEGYPPGAIPPWIENNLAQVEVSLQDLMAHLQAIYEGN